MGVGAGLYMYDCKVFTFAISSPDKFLFLIVDRVYMPQLRRYRRTELCDCTEMATFWRFIASCIFSEPRVARFRLHLKFALRSHHVWKYGRHPLCDG